MENISEELYYRVYYLLYSNMSENFHYSEFTAARSTSLYYKLCTLINKKLIW